MSKVVRLKKDMVKWGTVRLTTDGILTGAVKVDRAWKTERVHMWSLHLYAAVNLLGFHRLTEIDFNDSQIGDMGLQVVAHVLGRAGSGVRKLRLQGCELTDACASDVEQLCGPAMDEIDLSNNSLSVSVVDALQKLGRSGTETESLLDMLPDIPRPAAIFEMRGDVLVCIQRDAVAGLHWRLSLFTAVKCGLVIRGVDLSHSNVDVDFFADMLHWMPDLRLLSMQGCGLEWKDVELLCLAEHPSIEILNLCSNNLADGPPAEFRFGDSIKVLLAGDSRISDIRKLQKALQRPLVHLDVSYNVDDDAEKRARHLHNQYTDFSNQHTGCPHEYRIATDGRLNYFYHKMQRP